MFFRSFSLLKIVCPLLLIFTIIASTSGQPVKEFQIVRTHPADIADRKLISEYPLLNSRSEISGSYQIIQSGDMKEFLISIEGRASFPIYPMSSFVVSKDGNRVIAYGRHVDHSVISPMQIRTYSSNGELIASLDTDIWPPYCLGIQDNGDIWIAGKDGYRGVSFVLRKISSGGETIWERSLPPKAPMRLVFSLDNSSAALELFDEIEDTRALLHYNRNGDLLHELAMPSFFSGTEFVSNEIVFLHSAYEWRLYRLEDPLSLISAGRLQGNPLGAYPVTGFPRGDTFCLLTTGDADARGYRLQAIDSETGQILAESFFAGAPSWQPSRICRVTERENIELLLDENRSFELAIE